MFVLVITGGLGAGKSTAAEYFKSRGATIIDLDDVAARVMMPGAPVLDELAAEFGPEVIAEDGSVDRVALASVAFSSEAASARLNEIVHPLVAREVGPAIQEIRLLPNQPAVVVLEVPLLAEAPLYAELGDAVLAISAPEETRIRRAVDRGMDETDARQRLACQSTDAEREELATTVIRNDGGRDEFVRKLESFWSGFVASGGSE